MALRIRFDTRLEAAIPGGPCAPAAARSLIAAMNLLIVALFTLLVISSYRQFMPSGSLRSFSVLAVNSLFLSLYLTRRPAKAETPSMALWTLALAGTALPLLMRPAAHPGAVSVGACIQIVGIAALAAALLSLRRSFAVAPANRGVRRGGLYRLVRHPVYLAELTVLAGVVLADPTISNAAIWVCECIVQLARARAEEQLLLADPLYRAYCRRVRYRFIPGVI